LVTIKTKEQIAKMKQAGIILADIHKQLRSMIKPGVTTWEIDQFAESYMRSHGATPEQIGYRGYEYATCASVNDVICHGFPKREPLQNGDIVKIDMVVNLNGWLADSAWCYAVGTVSKEAEELMATTKEALYRGIAQAKPGNRLGDISHAIQSFAEERGYSVVRDFTGHAIGQTIHEDPHVPHYGPPGRGLRLKEGMVITIEPMINTGAYGTKIDADGWTARTIDGGLSCQYEHTVAITADGPYILTDQDE